ncbi:MAG: hypothetical protein LBQ66_08370 [Planctomycetaceae bacterium]|jgi:Tfp pilus assembly protein PilF|nr:hypothetical protein [Planctomycetaceae bacterium]
MAHNDRVQKIHNLVKRGDWKQAYKEAKFIAKLSNTDELKLLIATSLWNWIKDQVKRNQYDEAKLNVQELIKIDKKIIPPEIRDEFPTIFLTLGLNYLLPDDLKTDTASFDVQVKLLDQYIISNLKSNDLLPETLADANIIKKAFTLIESRDDSAAQQELSQIAFRSPAAEWHILLRGLIAHYNGNDKNANESWQRLSQNRPTAQIAKNLQNLFIQQNEKDHELDFVNQFSSFNSRSNSKLSRKIDLIDNLRIVGDCLKSKKYREILQRIPLIRKLLQNFDNQTFGRILRLIHVQLLERAQSPVVKQFVDQNLPLPLDPHGNRSYALLADRVLRKGNEQASWLNDQSFYWNKFIDDISHIDVLSQPMKSRAKAIVGHRIAKLLVTEYEDVIQHTAILLNENNSDEQHEYIKAHMMLEADSLVHRVSSAFDRAINYDPTYLDNFDSMKNFVANLPEPVRMAYFPSLHELDQKILEYNPTNIDALNALFKSSLEQNDNAAAAKFLEKLEQVNPLSKMNVYYKLMLQIRLIRSALSRKNLIEAKQRLDEYTQIQAPNLMFYSFDLLYLALLYIYEVLSDNLSKTRDVFAQGKKFGIEKQLPIIYAIILESKSIPLPKKIEHNLHNKFLASLRQSLRSPNTLAALGDLIASSTTENQQYLSSDYDIFSIEYGQDIKDDLMELGQRYAWRNEKDAVCECRFWWMLLNCERVRVSTSKGKVDIADISDVMYYLYKLMAIAERGVKKFPNSVILSFLALDSECSDTLLKYANKSLTGHKKLQKLAERYKQFLQSNSQSKDNPELAKFINVAEEKIKDLVSLSEIVRRGWQA